ncbi:MAG: helix-turn-helix transcriptional regulator [Patescibacteria group bacterium]
MQSYKKFKKEVFAKRPLVKKAYKELETEYALIEQLIAYRLHAGVTQSELAKKIGTKQSAISRFESGSENPTLSFLRKIADALDVNLSVKIS